jgi:probable rRNA maturation factor
MLAKETRLAESRLKKLLHGGLPPVLSRQAGIKRNARPVVSLRVVGSSAMASLNRRWMGKSYATDVLSFPAPAFFRGQGILGELVICGPTLRRQAREQGHPARSELDILLIHGLLHLLGLDHEKSRAQAAVMARWEKKLARRLGHPADLPGLITRAGLRARDKLGKP